MLIIRKIVILILVFYGMSTLVLAQDEANLTQFEGTPGFSYPADWQLRDDGNGALRFETPEDNLLVVFTPQYFESQQMFSALDDPASFSVLMNLAGYPHDTVAFTQLGGTEIVGKEFALGERGVQSFLFDIGNDERILMVAIIPSTNFDAQFSVDFLSIANELGGSFIPVDSTEPLIPVNTALSRLQDRLGGSQAPEGTPTPAAETSIETTLIKLKDSIIPTLITRATPTPTPTTVPICLISTDASTTVGVRLGPTLQNAIFVWLPVGQFYEPISKSTDGEGNLWYQLNVNDITDRTDVTELWVQDSSALMTRGDCDALQGSFAIIENNLDCEIAGYFNGYAGLPLYEFIVAPGTITTIEMSAGDYFYRVSSPCLDIQFDVRISGTDRLVHGERP